MTLFFYINIYLVQICGNIKTKDKIGRTIYLREVQKCTSRKYFL